MRRRLAALTLAAASLFVADRADAFCGFYVAPGDKPLYNDATMVALLRDGTRTALSMSNNYKGPAADFAMVVPVPVVLQKENVKVLNKSVFSRLEAISAPRLVEYWEQDPCNPYPPPMAMPTSVAMGGTVKSGAPEGAGKDYGVKIEAKFEVGEYQILVLSAKQSDGLESWLHDNKYNIPQGASAALAPYVKEQWKFFVAKIDITKVALDANGSAQLSPLRFHYESNDFRLPVRLGLLNAPTHAAAKQDLLLFVLSKTDRYEVANYPNVFIPTNLEVTDATRTSFAPFYATLFDAAVDKAQGKGVVTEYSWTTPFFNNNMGMKCDPCPSQPITAPADLAALGGDVLWGLGAGGPPMSKGPTWGPGGGMGGLGNVVITRLHARYDSKSLGDDLVFKVAGPVVGGREGGGPAGNEQGAKPSSQNNFQARYVIRHPWTGAVKCAKPQRGIWGGPPGSWNAKPPPPAAATGLASVVRTGIKLTSYLKAGLPKFDVKAAGPTPPFVAPPTPPDPVVPDAGPEASVTGADAGTIVDATVAPPIETVAPPSSSAGPAPVPSVQPQPHGCGCDIPGGAKTTSTALAGLAASAIALSLARRRRR